MAEEGSIPRAGRRPGKKEKKDAPSLTDRECQVLTLIARGMSSGQAAQELGVVKRTIDFHLDGVYKKLGVTNRVQAIIEALRRGILTPPETRPGTSGPA
jgi:DNA-binding NarL/FixJ family response regulator